MEITESRISETGLFYESDGGTMHGMYFKVYKEKTTTKEELQEAKRYIKWSQDCLGIKALPITQEVWRKATKYCNRRVSLLTKASLKSTVLK